ncbi:MAG: hypothetical protein Q7T19_10410 [Caulobacter sp.]|nr:hypothetical protein [Caulobacter sp.]
MKRWPAITALAVMAVPVTYFAADILAFVAGSRNGQVDDCYEGLVACRGPGVSIFDFGIPGAILLIALLGWWAGWLWLAISLKRGVPQASAVATVPIVSIALALWFVSLLVLGGVGVTAGLTSFR